MCRMAGELDLSVDRGSRTPLGAQLAGRIRTAVQNGTLVSGERVPSVRELADIAGVNVNTARAVYARLESEGVVHSEQGRGTFVMERASGGAATRQELHRQIAELEAALVRLPPPPLASDDSKPVAMPGRAALLSTEDLEAVRDRLVVRLRELDVQRAEVLQRLDELGTEDEAEVAAEAMPPRRATPSLAGARIRWVGA
jgi:DNA-binding transcriptional regulator YhcF (GntR family)